jgi:diketogulonate reductase-like aldo/keto reductase
MKHLALNNGVEMPALGFGVFQMRDPEESNATAFFNHRNPEWVERLYVSAALESGTR